MREIKFRTWGKEEECWVSIDSIVLYSNGSIEYLVPEADDQPPYLEEEVEIMQYTGLDDVNGVNIYEGDIVEFEVGLIRAKAEVVYSRDQFIVDINSAMSRSLGAYFVKVIGNKFENMELLGDKK